jgi:hypothetical protein
VILVPSLVFNLLSDKRSCMGILWKIMQWHTIHIILRTHWMKSSPNAF